MEAPGADQESSRRQMTSGRARAFEVILIPWELSAEALVRGNNLGSSGPLPGFARFRGFLARTGH
jgi:hypothetical protein